MRMNILNGLAKKGNIFTIEEVIKSYNMDRNVLAVILNRLENRGWIERIEKGKYMIIPLGAEKGKYTLNEFIIGSVLIEPCCISYWSALNFHGLTEQIPHTVFIQTPSRKKKQELEIFGVKYKIVRVKSSKYFGFDIEWIDNNKINITDREKTIIDCLDKPQYCGGVVEVAKAVRNKLNEKKLVDYAKRIGNSGVIRRLGYLYEVLGIDTNLPEIKTRNYLLLDPTMPEKGSKNAKWRLIINLDRKILGSLE